MGTLTSMKQIPLAEELSERNLRVEATRLCFLTHKGRNKSLKFNPVAIMISLPPESARAEGWLSVRFSHRSIDIDKTTFRGHVQFVRDRHNERGVPKTRQKRKHKRVNKSYEFPNKNKSMFCYETLVIFRSKLQRWFIFF